MKYIDLLGICLIRQKQQENVLMYYITKYSILILWFKVTYIVTEDFINIAQPMSDRVNFFSAVASNQLNLKE